MMNGTAVDDRIGIILDLNACYPVAVDIILLKQTLNEGTVEGERGWEEVGGGGREGEEKEGGVRREGEEERRREEGEEKERRREGTTCEHLLKQKPRDAHEHTRRDKQVPVHPERRRIPRPSRGAPHSS